VSVRPAKSAAPPASSRVASFGASRLGLSESLEILPLSIRREPVLLPPSLQFSIRIAVWRAPLSRKGWKEFSSSIWTK